MSSKKKNQSPSKAKEDKILDIYNQNNNGSGQTGSLLESVVNRKINDAYKMANDTLGVAPSSRTEDPRKRTFTEKCFGKRKDKNPRGGILSRSMGVGYVPRDINFGELAVHKYGVEKLWPDLTLKEQVNLIRDALTVKDFLIDPNCKYMKVWDMIIGICLLYTAMLTPFEVAFMETQLDGWFIMNIVIMLVFIKDIIMQFSLKVTIQKPTGTTTLRDKRQIRNRYLKGWFTIDIVSIIPFDIVGVASNDESIQKLKAFRIIRLLRLLKILRILRASRMIQRWSNHISMPFSHQSLIKFSVILTFFSHWMACVWGLVGRSYGTNLECLPDGTYSRLSEDDQYYHRTLGISWITNKGWEDSPDNPCSPVDLWVVCLHFSVMTITSIGYGDITPTRGGEYIFCVLCMFSGGVCWAYIIGSACGVISNMDPIRINFEHSMDQLNRMLKEQNVCNDLRLSLREFLHESKYHQSVVRSQELSNDFSPKVRDLLTMETVVGASVANVHYFRGLDLHVISEIAQNLEAALYSRRETCGPVCDVMCIVDRGAAARLGKIMVPGATWGEDMIVQSRVLQENVVTIALTFVELLSLTHGKLFTIVADHPKAVRRIRRAAVIMAFKRALHLVLSARRNGKWSPEMIELEALLTSQPGITTKNGRKSSLYVNKDSPRVKLMQAVHAGKVLPDESAGGGGANAAKLDDVKEEICTYIDDKFEEMTELISPTAQKNNKSLKTFPPHMAPTEAQKELQALLLQFHKDSRELIEKFRDPQVLPRPPELREGTGKFSLQGCNM